MEKCIVMNFTFMLINIVHAVIMLCFFFELKVDPWTFSRLEMFVEADLNISEPSLESEDHDIKIQITEEHWNEDTTKMLHCSLAAGLKYTGQIQTIFSSVHCST